MNVVEYDAIEPVVADDAWKLYERIFTPVDELAAQRHLMYEAEFRAVADDKRIAKFLAYTDDGALYGLSVITDDLSAWSLISPAFFARRWPRHYADRRIFYVGFVGVAGWFPGTLHVFSSLIEAMQSRVESVAGIAVMDFCGLNADVRRLSQAARLVQERLSGGPVPAEVIDRQEF